MPVHAEREEQVWKKNRLLKTIGLTQALFVIASETQSSEAIPAFWRS